MEQYGSKVLVLCLFFAIVLPFVTLLYILKFFHPFLVVTICINIFAFIVVLVCYIMERKKRDK